MPFKFIFRIAFLCIIGTVQIFAQENTDVAVISDARPKNSAELLTPSDELSDVVIEKTVASETYIISNTTNRNDADVSLTAGNYVAAYGNMLIANSVIALFDRFVLQADYANVTLETIQYNLTHQWVWDQDSFTINHFGHPYQGSLYYAGARANGLGFWNSALTTIAGSITWELFAETEKPSINDLIATTFGGITLGEILHRLYIEAHNRSFLLAGLISPMDAVNEMLGGNKPLSSPRQIYYASLAFSCGRMVSHNNIILPGVQEDRSSAPFVIGTSANIVYGNPYGMVTNKPFSHFTLTVDGEWSPDFYSFTIFSDGYLASFAPAFCNNNRASSTAALSLHYDLIFNKAINYSTNALGFSFKQERDLPHNFILQYQFHLHWLMLSASDYYYSRNLIQTNEAERTYDFGTGEGIKIGCSLEHERWGKFSFMYAYNGIHTIPSSIPNSGSGGYVIIEFINVDYEHHLHDDYYWGVSLSLYRKNGKYDSAPDIRQAAGDVKLFINKRLIEPAR